MFLIDFLFMYIYDHHYTKRFSVAKTTLDKQLQMWICLKDADIIMTDVDISNNKLKSFKVAQVKD